MNPRRRHWFQPAIQAMVSLGRKKHAEETAESLFEMFDRFLIYGDGNEDLYPGLEVMMTQAAASFASISQSKIEKFIATKLRSESEQDIVTALQFYFLALEVQLEDTDGYQIPVAIRDALIDVWTTKPNFKIDMDLESILFGYSFGKNNEKADAKLVEWLWKYRERSIKNGWTNKDARVRTASLLLKHDSQDKRLISDVLDQLSHDLSTNSFNSLSAETYRVAVQIEDGLHQHIPKLIEQFQKTATKSRPAYSQPLRGRAGRLALTYSHRICMVELLGQQGAQAKDAVPHIEAALAKTSIEAWATSKSTDDVLNRAPQLLVNVEALDSYTTSLPPQAAPPHGAQPIAKSESTQFVLSSLHALYQITGKKPDITRLKPKPAVLPAK